MTLCRINFKTNINLMLKNFGSGALPGKKLLLGIIENNNIDAYSRSSQVKYRLA